MTRRFLGGLIHKLVFTLGELLLIQYYITIAAMELVTLLWGLAQIVGTGALTKLGENIFDEASPRVRELFGVIQRKFPQTKTAQAITAGKDLDYYQTFIDVEQIEQDPEVVKLAEEVQALIAKNQALQTKLNQEVAKVQAKYMQINEGPVNANQFNAPIKELTIYQDSDSG